MGDTGLKGNVMSMEPKDGQGLGYCSGGQQDVRDGQHGEEEVHGLVKATFCDDDHYQDAVPQDCSAIHEAEGYRQPNMISLQPRDTKEDKNFRVKDGKVGVSHDDLGSPLYSDLEADGLLKVTGTESNSEHVQRSQTRAWISKWWASPGGMFSQRTWAWE